jgi:CCR4-NOT transcription complex subunit 1 TTP binding domain
VLFGSLVHRRLVSGGALATALRCVAEAARSPPGSKLSKFALEALAQFRDELASWPDFCATLLQVPVHSPAPQKSSGLLVAECLHCCPAWPSITTLAPVASSLSHASSETARLPQQPTNGQ